MPKENTARVIDAQALDSRHVRVRFADGRTGTIDMTQFLAYPAWQPLRDPQLFATAHAAHGTVTWDNNIDIAPERAHELAQ